jgi:hypothetical protein
MWNGGMGAPLSEVWNSSAPSEFSSRASPGSSSRAKKAGKRKAKATATATVTASMDASAHIAPSADQLCNLFDRGRMNRSMDDAMNFHQDVSGGAVSCMYDGPGLGGGYVGAAPFDDPRYQYASTLYPTEPTNTPTATATATATPTPTPTPTPTAIHDPPAVSSRRRMDDDDDDDDFEYPPPAPRAPASLEDFYDEPAPTSAPATVGMPLPLPLPRAALPPATTAIQPGQVADLALYAVSGVLLIFILEQFVQLGTHLRYA